MTRSGNRSPGRRARLAPIAVIAVAYCLTNYGGTRSPDGEVVFRAAESLAAGHGLAVETELESKPGFGTARGRDGRMYSIFGPGESIALAPVIAILNATGLPQRIGMPPSVSHFVQNGGGVVLDGQKPVDPERHALRFLASPFNMVVTLLAALVLWELAWLLTRRTWIASATTLAWALGTAAWSFAVSDFSEPLFTLLALASLWPLMRCDPAVECPPRRAVLLFALSGLALGGAVVTHVTGVLFIPFFSVYTWVVARRAAPERPLALVGAFALGLALPLAWLGWFNHARFGDVFETGRKADLERYDFFRYGRWVTPWRGLYGFAFGSARSLFVYAPPILLGIFGLPLLARRDRALVWLIASSAILRVLFIAARSDWSGGFAQGPRLLVVLLPLLVLPAACLLERLAERGATRRIGLWFATVAVGLAVQAYLCVGEMFSFIYLTMRHYSRALNVQIIQYDRLYLDWSAGPLGHLHQHFRGPWMLRAVPLSNLQLWAVLTLVFTAWAGWVVWPAWRRAPVAELSSTSD